MSNRETTPWRRSSVRRLSTGSAEAALHMGFDIFDEAEPEPEPPPPPPSEILTAAKEADAAAGEAAAGEAAAGEAAAGEAAAGEAAAASAAPASAEDLLDVPVSPSPAPPVPRRPSGSSYASFGSYTTFAKEIMDADEIVAEYIEDAPSPAAWGNSVSFNPDGPGEGWKVDGDWKDGDGEDWEDRDDAARYDPEATQRELRLGRTNDQRVGEDELASVKRDKVLTGDGFVPVTKPLRYVESKRLVGTVLVLALVAALVVVCAVIKADLHERKTAAAGIQPPPEGASVGGPFDQDAKIPVRLILPPPPVDLVTICSLGAVASEGGYDRCKELCVQAECCFLAPEHTLSCRGEENRDGCLQYEDACDVLDLDITVHHIVGKTRASEMADVDEQLASEAFVKMEKVEKVEEGVSEDLEPAEDANVDPSSGDKDTVERYPVEEHAMSFSSVVTTPVTEAVPVRTQTVPLPPQNINIVCSKDPMGIECARACKPSVCCQHPIENCRAANPEACAEYGGPCRVVWDNGGGKR